MRGGRVQSLAQNCAHSQTYILIYIVRSDDVEIVAVIHGARDLPAALAARIEADEP